MCGRVIQARDPTLYTHVVGSEPERPLPNTPPHYNGVDVLRLGEDGQRELVSMRWGLVPFF